MKNQRSIILFFLFFISLTCLNAQEDIKGSEDHPLLTRYPGAYINSYEDIKYREYSLATGPISGYRYIKEKKDIAGHLYRITYIIDETVEKLSLGEVYQDYLLAFKKAEIEILANGSFPTRNVKNTVGGGSWIGVALKDNRFGQGSSANLLFSGTSSSGGTFSIIGSVKRPDQTTYVAIYGERHSNKKIVIHVDILEEQLAETGKVFADADYIKKEMEEKGMVIIYGINFDYDSATIKEESKAAIDEIAAFLKAHPDLDIYIVGHTDMKGKLEYNMKLSKDRANALVDSLVEDYEIDRSKLEANGVGPLAPKSTNDTEEGRALNRRVELVKKF